MLRRTSRSLGLAALLPLLPVVASAEPGAGGGWWQRSRLTGEWGGWRTAFAERGVEVDARYTTGLWSNLRGGFGTGTRYEGFAEWGLEADLDALLGWTGGGFALDGYSYHGGQPSSELLGVFPTQTVSGHETAVSIRFYEILLRQTWGDGRFLVEVGQLAADDDFFVSDMAAVLLNGTFGFLGFGRVREILPFFPLATPGAYLQARTGDARWEVHAGVYNADVGEDESSNIGFGWSFDNGVSFLAELKARRSPFGRPGLYAVGGAATSAKVEDFSDGSTARGSYGLYALIDQLLVAQTPSRPGLGFFLRGFVVPPKHRTLARWYVDFGLHLTRPLPGRGQDVLALGFAHVHFASDYVSALRAEGLGVSRRQSVLELTYRLQATPWLVVQPDLQFFFDPHFSRRDATAIGLRAVVEL